jgi:hypothetical protein
MEIMSIEEYTCGDVDESMPPSVKKIHIEFSPNLMYSGSVAR